MKKNYMIGAVAVILVSFSGWAAWDYHEEPAFCGAACHIMQPYLESWVHSPELANKHAAEGVVCLDCHEPTIQEQVNELTAYATGDYSIPLEERAFSREMCLECHEGYEQIAELTADITVDGVQINPHAYVTLNPDAPEPEAITATEYASPHGEEYGELECSLCHKVHKDSPGLNTCYSCHHDALFTLECESCHADDEIVFSEQPYPEDGCGRCHDYDGSTEQLVALTEFYTVNGDLMNPHAYPIDPKAPEPEAYLDPEFYDPEAPNPHDTDWGELDCYQCHKNMEEASLVSCEGCHHDEIYTKPCVDCHKEEDFRERVEQNTQ